MARAVRIGCSLPYGWRLFNLATVVVDLTLFPILADPQTSSACRGP
jgi:hypothetical protein